MEFAAFNCFVVFSTFTTLLPGLMAHGNKLTKLENKLLNMVVECKSCKGQPGAYLGKNRPAFTATLSTNPQTLSKSNKIVKFDKVILNQGVGYNPKTGIFAAPKSGLYQISVTIMSNGGKKLSIQLVKNGSAVLNLYGPAIHGGTETANPVLDLNEGDKVSVEIHPGSTDEILGHNYSYFSGYYI